MKIKFITEEEIVFEDGRTITYHHDQDCCERVYADFMAVEDGIKDHEFKNISIVGVKNAGFKLNGYFIPCYNSQNGCYSSDLELIINYPDGRRLIQDISEFVEDQVD